MKAKSNHLVRFFWQWHTQTYDFHRLRSDSYLNLSQLCHRLDIIEIWNQYHEGKGYHQG
jgi:hypothetical protein